MAIRSTLRPPPPTVSRVGRRDGPGGRHGLLILCGEGACRELRGREPQRYRRLMLLLCEAKPDAEEGWCDLAAREGVKVPKRPAKRRRR